MLSTGTVQPKVLDRVKAINMLFKYWRYMATKYTKIIRIILLSDPGVCEFPASI